MSGMWELSQHLIKTIQIKDLSPNEIESWANFCALLEDNVDLESALHQVSLSPVLTNRIVLSTWELLVPQDIAVFERSLTDLNLFPLGTLLKHMLRSTTKQINVITPNYDRLAEYACEQENIHHFSGFSLGYRGVPVKKNYLRPRRQVNIWKVHGSLGWFVNDQGVIFSLTNIQNIPDGLTPLIVTPGSEKYRSTHRDPYKTTIHEADDAIDAASSYLCIGFGFNDEHIQEKLVNRCAKDDATIIVVTYQLSDSAKRFLFGNNSIRYLAIESQENDLDSVAYSSELNGPIKLDGNYWSLDGFLKLLK
ncbi:MAG: SIR2 family protein [Pseudomonadales bacterium]|nr:SIR2 family protein [Pseudomonadales bacterium]